MRGSDDNARRNTVAGHAVRFIHNTAKGVNETIVIFCVKGGIHTTSPISDDGPACFKKVRVGWLLGPRRGTADVEGIGPKQLHGWVINRKDDQK